jgi:hypothetical protein
MCVKVISTVEIEGEGFGIALDLFGRLTKHSRVEMLIWPLDKIINGEIERLLAERVAKKYGVFFQDRYLDFGTKENRGTYKTFITFLSGEKLEDYTTKRKRRKEIEEEIQEAKNKLIKATKELWEVKIALEEFIMHL